MEGLSTEPAYFDRPFAALAEHWRTRWLLDRAERVDGWRQWQREDTLKTVILTESGHLAHISAEFEKHGTDKVDGQ